MGNFQPDAEVAARIDRIIKDAGRSRLSVANAAKIAPTTFDRLVDGGADWKLGQLNRTARALGVSVTEFVTDEVAR